MVYLPERHMGKGLCERFDAATASLVGDEGFQAKVLSPDSPCICCKGRFVAGYANLHDPTEAAAQAAKPIGRIPRLLRCN